ncbi:uncharacterized protein A4U43_C06F13900 [Asparagus officinalis]|uniref:Uncharacterized protein n=1 Tax=Asparagus officinalis TaxID=4686 RepID=A0A5P1EQV6_ASPOF|nr:uncharacterized protein A4U43_C06F13900 [Asparagus officinalis]
MEDLLSTPSVLPSTRAVTARSRPYLIVAGTARGRHWIVSRPYNPTAATSRLPTMRPPHPCQTRSSPDALEDRDQKRRSCSADARYGLEGESRRGGGLKRRGVRVAKGEARAGLENHVFGIGSTGRGGAGRGRGAGAQKDRW